MSSDSELDKDGKQNSKFVQRTIDNMDTDSPIQGGDVGSHYAGEVPPINKDDDDDEEDEPVRGNKNSMMTNPNFDSDKQLQQQPVPNTAMIKQDIENALKEGPNVYELYSVLVHRGSATGGHYYVYIKNLDTGKWFEFNDSVVSEIDEREVTKAFGDELHESHPNYRISAMSSTSSRMYSMFGSSANAYMLLYRKADPSKNLKIPSKDEIPEALRKHIETEVERSKQKKLAKQTEREMVQVRVIFQNQDKIFKLHQSITLGTLFDKSIEAHNLPKYPRDCLRLRSYQPHNDMPAEPFTPDMYDKTLDQLRFWSNRTIMLESKEPGTEFPAYNPSHTNLKLIFYNHNNKSFETPQILSLDRDAKVKDLRNLLKDRFHIPPENQRLVRESISFYGNPPWYIIDNNPENDEFSLNDVKIFDGSKLYLEHFDPQDSSKSISPLSNETNTNVAEISPSCAEIERTRNLIDIKFNIPGSEEFSEALQLSKKVKLSELRAMIADKLHLSIDDFKISRGSYSWKQELINDQQTLEDNNISDSSKIYVEKGKPMKEGEVKIQFTLFKPEKLGAGFEDLFEMLVPDTMTIKQLKQDLSVKLKNEKQIDIPPAYLRVRETVSKSPTKVYLDDQTIKSIVQYYSLHSKALLVQLLSTPEPCQNEGDFACFVQVWSPSKYQLGERFEIVLPKTATFGAVKQTVLSEKLGVASHEISVAPYIGIWPGYEVNEVADLNWETNEEYNHRCVYDMMKDGDIIYVKNNTEQLKQLSKEEKRKLDQEVNAKKRFEGKKKKIWNGWRFFFIDFYYFFLPLFLADNITRKKKLFK